MKKTTLITSFISSIGIAALALAATSASAQGPDPKTVSIRSIVYAGTGCPAGTVASNMSPDAKAFTLLFDSFVAEAGPGIPLSSGRKNCRVLVDLNFPQGWSYTLMSVDFRGYMNLDPGTTGEQSATYYFQGSNSSLPMKSTVFGPLAQDYHFRDNLALTATIWSPCGANRAVNIGAAVAVRANTGRRALMTVDSIDGEVKQIYGLQWMRCR